MAMGKSVGKPRKKCAACEYRYEEGDARLHGMNFDQTPYFQDGLMRLIHDGEAVRTDWANAVVRTLNMVLRRRK